MCFQTVEELVNKDSPNGSALVAWDRSIQENILQGICKSELDDVSRDPEYWITELELLRGDLQKMEVIIDDLEIIAHIMIAFIQHCTLKSHQLYTLT